MSTPVMKHTATIKQIARELGFDGCGIARAGHLEEDERRLAEWLNKGMHAGMKYMENHFEMRVDPTKLVPGARSVITLILNYYPEEKQDEGLPKVAKYAYGKDYHLHIREKLNFFLYRIREEIGEISGRGFVDSAPVLERSWATRSGLGWIGKNSNLLTRNGSFYFIATLVTDLELSPDDPFAHDYCGTCNRCVEACPTEAIMPDRSVDAGKCISYFTIELKDMVIPGEFNNRFQNWIFGCDICQDVCPWTRFAEPTKEKAFDPLPGLLDLSLREWEEMTEKEFRERFKDSPISRPKWKGIQRNAAFLKGDLIKKEPL